MATRTVDFLTGFNTSTAPTSSDPIASSDNVTLGYFNTNAAKRSSWYDRAADNTAVRAILTDRFNGMIVFNYGTDIAYKWDSGSSAVDDGVNVLTPTDAPATGRFISVFVGGGSTSAANDFELLIEKLNQEHLGDWATPLPNGHFDSFERARFEWEVRLAETYVSGTSAKIVINPLYLESADPSTDSAANWVAGGAGTTLTAGGTGKVGTNFLLFNKDNSGTDAYVEIQPVSLAVPKNKKLYFWAKVTATTGLASIFVEVGKDTSMTDSNRYELTLDASGAAITASTGDKFMELDLTVAPTSVSGAGWDEDADAIALFRPGFETTSAGQTYTGIGFDGFMFGDTTGLLYKKGEILTMYNTSTRDTFQVDAASTNVQGIVTLASGMANGYTASNASTAAKAVRSTMQISGDGRAVRRTGLSGTVVNTQEVRISRFLPAALSGATVCAYIPFDTKKGLRITAISAGVSVDVSDPGNNSAQLLSTHTARFVQVIGSDDREDYIPRSTQYTLDGNASHSSGTTTIPLASTTGLELGDIFLREQITPRISVGGVTSNENLQTMTLESVIVNNDGLTYPGAGNLFAHYLLGGRNTQEATRNLRGTGSALTETGTVTKNLPFFNRQFYGSGFSSSNYYTLSIAQSTAMDSDVAGMRVSWAGWYLAGTPTTDHSIAANYSASVNQGYGLFHRGATGKVSLVCNGSLDNHHPLILTPGNLYHIALTLNGPGASEPWTIWVNGVPYTDPDTSPIDNSTGQVYFGYTTSGSGSVGPLADWQLWSGYKLTNTDVLKLYNAGVPRKLGSFDSYALHYQKTGMNGQKLMLEGAVSSVTDADDIYFRGLAALEC